MKSQTETEIENIRAIAEHAAKRLTELEAKLKAEREAKARYTPSEHDSMTPIDVSRKVYSRQAYVCRTPLPPHARWRSFPNQTSANLALAMQRHYLRLVKLSTDLNPSRIPGGAYGVCYSRRGKTEWVVSESPASNSCDDLFESFEAATRACDILNREGWLPPVLDADQGFGVR